MKKNRKKSNFNIVFSFPELNISFSWEGYLPQLQKLINKLNPKKKWRVIHSYPDFMEAVVKMYEEGKLAVFGIHEIVDLVDFIHYTFEIRNLRNPEEKLERNTLKSTIYKFTGLGNVKK